MLERWEKMRVRGRVIRKSYEVDEVPTRYSSLISSSMSDQKSLLHVLCGITSSTLIVR